MIQNNTIPKAELPESVVTDAPELEACVQHGNSWLAIHTAAGRVVATVPIQIASAAANARAEGWLPIESAPVEGLHIRGLWIHSLKDGRLNDKSWRAFVGYMNEAGRFVDPEYGEDFGWEDDDYEAWHALPPAPEVKP